MNKQYIHGGWAHIFHDNGPVTELRFVYDQPQEKIVAMEIKRAMGWQPSSATEMADVEDSLKNTNEDALANPEGWGLEETNFLPEWTAPKQYQFVRREDGVHEVRFVVDGKPCPGYLGLLSGQPGEWEAEWVDGSKLGSFQTPTDAAAALANYRYTI